MKPAFSALWNLDLAFADVVATASEPHLAAIRLAWWRERLEALDETGDVLAEPRLQATAAELLSRAVTGRELSRLEDAWLPLLSPFPWSGLEAEALIHRGRILFGIGARLLGVPSGEAESAGALWSLVDGEQHCSDPQSREMLRRRAAVLLRTMPQPVPARLRVLTVLAALAGADLVREASGLGRLSAAVRHRLLGHFPR